MIETTNCGLMSQFLYYSSLAHTKDGKYVTFSSCYLCSGYMSYVDGTFVSPYSSNRPTHNSSTPCWPVRSHYSLNRLLLSNSFSKQSLKSTFLESDISMSTFLVTGATGKQGRATVNALLAQGAKVHAVVRDPTRDAARELEELGVLLFQGCNSDFGVFYNAAKGCSGIFLNLIVGPDNSAPGKEAEGILCACRRASVRHVVASTSCFAGDRLTWDIPENEGEICEYYSDVVKVEEAVRQSGLECYTIIRPGWFHTNYLLPMADYFYPELRTSATLVHSFEPWTVYPHTNVDDIGRFAAKALRDPAAFDGQEIELASENLRMDEVAEAIRKATGKQIALRKRTQIKEGVTPANNAAWHRWANVVGFRIDAVGLASQYSFRLTTLEEFLMKEKAKLRYIANDNSIEQ
jgi:uncharacterized protein YbjT (DUF2867 family)